MDKYVLVISLLILDCMAVCGKESVCTDFCVVFHTDSIATDSREESVGRADSREILTAEPVLVRGAESDLPDWLDLGRKPVYVALKSNMLYDVLALPNVGAELHLGAGWSISGCWLYGWWNSDRRHRYWRAYGGELSLRRWFGAEAAHKPLTGHHLGLYGQILTYDFEFGGEGQMAGKPGAPLWSKPSYAAGVEYGYSLPISRRLNIDFAVGIGYLGGTYYKYRPVDGHYVWQGTSRRHWFGPTKAEISLVWLLGRGNFNPKKGGAK